MSLKKVTKLTQTAVILNLSIIGKENDYYYTTWELSSTLICTPLLYYRIVTFNTSRILILVYVKQGIVM